MGDAADLPHGGEPLHQGPDVGLIPGQGAGNIPHPGGSPGIQDQAAPQIAAAGNGLPVCR